MDKIMPLDRLAQQWCGIQFSGFSSLFYSEWSNKNHTVGRRVPKQVCGASSDDVPNLPTRSTVLASLDKWQLSPPYVCEDVIVCMYRTM